MPEGVQAFLHWKNGYPPLYSCMADMPAETLVVFEYCLSTDRAQAANDDEALILEQRRAQNSWAALLYKGR